ncbi:MAG TPA: hypothetical protein VJ698_10765 [Noviherbaspirillum sp.]|uniref:hypothetical protein n=1 Tax=Noviherbaspirillum sp. TaxID=1926288 RepID=UPI002B4590AB|nr:hypothetical protein [Noviherbaspirillum sp.]HJV85947.1 hypothetical protein [Noviherbaspirillum sp.]
MLELYSHSSIDIAVDRDTLILHVNWKGYQSMNTGTSGCERILELMTRHKAYKILNDNSNVRGLWMEVAEWAAKDWFPRMKRAGMQQFAWVYSPTKFSQLSTDVALALIDTSAHGIEVFSDTAQALAWLTRSGQPSS